MKGSDLLVRCLENEHVEHVFQLPVEETLPILDSLSQSSLRLVTVRHEQSAAFMAGVYGRLTGRPGVYLATLGPGATNLATGIADAQMDRAPLVALTGQSPLEQVHKEYHQYVDVVSVLRPLTKWNARVQKTETIYETVRKAFSLARMEKPGATHLEFPEDITEGSVEGKPIRPTEAVQPRPTSTQVRGASELINRSRNPLILAGNGIIRARAEAAIRQLIAVSRIPVAHTFMGKGAVPDDDPLSLYAIGLPNQDPVISAFQAADLVLAVGYDIVEYAPNLWNPDKDKTMVHVDSTPAEIDSTYTPQVQLVGQIGKTLNILTECLKPRTSNRLKRFREAITEQGAETSQDDAFPMNPQRVLGELRNVMKRHDILVSDVGEHKLWIARTFPTYEPNTVTVSNGYSSMGIGIPGAIAAKLVHPKRNVAAVCGDGGFLMTCAELETAKRIGVSFTTLIFRDNSPARLV